MPSNEINGIFKWNWYMDLKCIKGIKTEKRNVNE